MATSHPIHPVAAEKLTELRNELEQEFGRTDSERKIVNALAYGATAAQVVGMLEAFARVRRQYNDKHEGEDGDEGAKARAVAAS